MAKKFEPDIHGTDRQIALKLRHEIARFALSEEGNVKQLKASRPPAF